jgi:hypothetical protein
MLTNNAFGMRIDRQVILLSTFEIAEGTGTECRNINVIK